jgi:hypothetical protein
MARWAKKAITDYVMQSKKLNKGEDSMKTCQIMLFGVGIAAYPFFFGPPTRFISNSNADISRVHLT